MTDSSTTSKTQERKSISISTMRVLAMFMIIAFHSMLFYTGKWWQFNGPSIPLWVKISEFLNTIDLPMFVFISGFLFGHLYINKNKYRDKVQFLLGKAQRLLIPYLFWGMFMVITMPSLNQWSELLTGISHLWFLLMLFEVFMITIWASPFLCFKASHLQWMLVFIGAVLLFNVYHLFSTHHYFLCLHAVLFYLPAFLLGMCCARFRLQERISGNFAIFLLPIALFVLASYLFLCAPFPFIANYTLQLITGYIVIICSFVLLCQKYNPGKTVAKFINHIDRLSMGIYIFNQIVINMFIITPSVRYFLGEHHYIGVPVLFVVGSIIPYFLSFLFNKSRLLKWTIG